MSRAHSLSGFPAKWLAMVWVLISLGVSGGAAASARLDHVVVVVLENTSYDQARAQPYIASLMAAGATFTNSYAITHPSQPNYLALWAGGTLGITDNTCPAPGSPLMAENLGHACEAAGLTWKSYVENLPAAGSTTCSADNGLYTRKHHPCPDFGNVNHQNERPYADLASDIAHGTLPDLALVIPNNCDNKLDCGADGWLSSNVPPMLNAIGPAGALILTWDEDDRNSSNHILTVFVGTPVKHGYVAAERVNHYTVLRALCESLGLTPFAGAASQPSITDVWAGPTPVHAMPWGSLKVHYR
jgi:acid phosphatase